MTGSTSLQATPFTYTRALCPPKLSPQIDRGKLLCRGHSERDKSAMFVTVQEET
eukprot:TRINITY_DN3633_c0_g1_i1.p3 TRINITY_DN3633_c0_g1~~TRINITY_DN3633_c0_g1_i1.p3  ORF type:complete len:54 (-),score=4.57 TRINITY_DN3633_c0_g1_i1:142-303(-)